METKTKSKVYPLAMTAVMAAVTCVLGPMSIPIGPVPISFTNLAIYISLYLLGWKRGTLSYLVYMLIGTVGMPVFSNYSGGMGKLFGPTGGYIIGFIPMAIIAGIVIDKSRNRGIQLAGMIVGTALCYAFGTAWFMAVYARTSGPVGVMTALGWCVFPYIIPDLVKLVLAVLLSRRVKQFLK